METAKKCADKCRNHVNEFLPHFTTISKFQYSDIKHKMKNVCIQRGKE